MFISENYITKKNKWKPFLDKEFEKDYMKDLDQFIEREKKLGKIIYPNKSNFFQAFSLSSLDKIKVVILGQDPYHGENQAHGLCFSVKEGVKIPPSLKNIFKELHSDLNIPIPESGNLNSWASQGVFLLNTTLSVESSRPGSHQNKGWEKFTDRVIEVLNQKKENLVFLLWGSFAQKKAIKLDNQKNLILKAPHPSPLSAYRGFLGCRHFSKTNDFLKRNNITEINWDQ